MPQQFQDLAELLDPFLPLPIRGKTYKVPAPDVATGLRAQATVAIAAKVRAGETVTPDDVAALNLDDNEETEFCAQMLGLTFDEMAADGLPWEYVRHAARTVFMWLVGDRDEAAKVWSSLGKAPRPAPQDRKPKKRASGGKTKKATSPSSSTPHQTPASPGTTS